LENFGPAVGLFLFALFTLGTGLRLQAAPGAGAETVLEALVKRLALVKVALGILGLVLVGGFAYLAFATEVGADYYPELLPLWLVAYLQLVALGLVFGCFGLARTDVRNNPGMRRLLFGYNTFFQTLLVLELLVVLVVIVYAMAPYTFQWSKSQGMYALSTSSKN